MALMATPLAAAWMPSSGETACDGRASLLPLSPRFARVGERADDRDAPHGGAIERQRCRVVLQQDDRLARDLERQRLVRRALDDDGGIERRAAVEDAEAELHAQDAAHGVVDRRPSGPSPASTAATSFGP